MTEETLREPIPTELSEEEEGLLNSDEDQALVNDVEPMEHNSLYVPSEIRATREYALLYIVANLFAVILCWIPVWYLRGQWVNLILQLPYVLIGLMFLYKVVETTLNVFYVYESTNIKSKEE